MKKFLSVILAAMILSLTACSENNSSVTSDTSINDGGAESVNNSESVSDNSSDANQNTTVQNTPNKVDDTLPQSEPANTVELDYDGSSIMKGTDGYYYCGNYQIDELHSVNYVPFYYDNKLGKSIILCSKPQCMHDGNDFCPATGKPKLTVIKNRSYFLYNDYIYGICKQWGITGKKDDAITEQIKLYRYDLMGNERSELATLTDPVIVGDDDAKTMIKKIVTHYGKMFYVKSGGESGNGEIYSLDLESGDRKQIMIPPNEDGVKKNTGIGKITADGDWLYYAIRYVRYNGQQIEVNLTYDKTVLHRFNIKTGETEIISEMPDIYSSFTVNNGIIYYTTVNRADSTFSLYAYDTKTKQTETFIENCQRENLDGKHLGDSPVHLYTDRKYLYMSFLGYNSYFSENKGDFYIYSLDGKELLHGLKGLPDVEKWKFSFRALNGEIYVDFTNFTPVKEESDFNTNEDVTTDKEEAALEEDDLISGVYMIKTEDLINGSTEWTKLYKAE